MNAYLDSSAFAKRYVGEKGSGRVLELCRSAERLFLSALTLPEIASFLNRLAREEQIAAEDYHLFKQVVLRDLSSTDILGVIEPILLGAVEVHEKCAIRTLDAIHLATARHVQCDLFVTGDRRQYEAAVALGLKAELVV
jgi:uncharacterized protein